MIFLGRVSYFSVLWSVSAGSLRWIFCFRKWFEPLPALGEERCSARGNVRMNKCLCDPRQTNIATARLTNESFVPFQGNRLVNKISCCVLAADSGKQA